MKKFFSFLFLFFFFLSPTYIYSESISSDAYVIEKSNIIIDIPEKDKVISTGTSPLAPSDIKKFSETGVYISHGPDDTFADTSFSFSISPEIIDYDTFSPGSIHRHTIYTTTMSSLPMDISIMLGQDQPLTSAQQKIIPPTLCNTDTPCTTTASSSWNMEKIPGTGYSIDTHTYRPVETLSLNTSFPLAYTHTLTKTPQTKHIDLVTVIPQDYWEGQYHQIIIIQSMPDIL